MNTIPNILKPINYTITFKSKTLEEIAKQIILIDGEIEK